MLSFLHTKSLESNLKSVEDLIRQNPELDYVTPMGMALEAVSTALPDGISQEPCAATRAMAVNLANSAADANRMGLDNYWASFTTVSVFFSASDLVAKNPKNSAAKLICVRALSIIADYRH
ncbi:hypothetical protein MB02_17240 [Croceicoccus estronivorus]|nr:hypothetical protein MB02_17240 [Croceicoccus estronivorus]